MTDPKLDENEQDEALIEDLDAPAEVQDDIRGGVTKLHPMAPTAMEG